MGVFMLTIIIYFGLFSLLLKLLDKPMVKKIENANSIEETINLKKELLEKRKKFLRIFIGIIIFEQIIEFLYIVFIYSAEKEIGIVGGIIAGVFRTTLSIIFVTQFLKYSNKNNKYLGNLSIDRAADLLSSGIEFALYLRGFERDVYDEKRIGKWEFSENTLAQVIQKGLGIPLCAVGMNKEIDCPLGGKRVYVDDNTWEEEVLELMKKAKLIVFLINDRTSCIWEIKNSADLYHKCVFVVDDLSKFNNAKTLLKGIIDLPEIPKGEVEDLPLDYDPRRFYFTSNNEMVDFNGELSDYCKMVGLSDDAVSESDLKKDKDEPFYTRPWFLFLMTIAAVRAITEIVKLFK